MVVKVPPPSPPANVPTVSGLGMIFLAVAIASIGTLMASRRRLSR